MRKYWNIFRVSLIERMTYRVDFLLSTFLRFLPLLTTVLLWTARSGPPSPRAASAR
jgi:ABC-2 type transport system permease protein